MCSDRIPENILKYNQKEKEAWEDVLIEGRNLFCNVRNRS
jgi:hypothetical protein